MATKTDRESIPGPAAGGSAPPPGRLAFRVAAVLGTVGAVLVLLGLVAYSDESAGFAMVAAGAEVAAVGAMAGLVALELALTGLARRSRILGFVLAGASGVLAVVLVALGAHVAAQVNAIAAAVLFAAVAAVTRPER